MLKKKKKKSYHTIYVRHVEKLIAVVPIEKFLVPVLEIQFVLQVHINTC